MVLNARTSRPVSPLARTSMWCLGHEERKGQRDEHAQAVNDNERVEEASRQTALREP
jgi:hypothetical protein